MAKINLLPWREELRKQRNKEFGVVAGVFAGIGLAVIIAVTLYYAARITIQEGRNQFLESEIAKLDKEIAEIKDLEKVKARLLQRITTIQDLQSNRTEIVHLFDETVKVLPDGVYLESVSQKGNKVTIIGIAESNSRVTDLTRNIKKSGWLKNPTIEVVQVKQIGFMRTAGFTMKITQFNPEKPKEEGEEGG